MKTRIYYNNDCIGEISNSYNDLDENSLPRINSILLKGNISLEELNLLSATQVRQLISQIQNVRYSETLPANPVINTLYYVGTSAPYNVYLYIEDDTTQAITRLDMGTTEQDLSQYQEKVDNSLETTSKNIVGAINENKANIDLKQNSTDDRLTTTAKTIYGAINEINGNKVTSISSSSTDKEYPSAKAVYDNFAPKDSVYISGTYQQLFRNVNDAVFNFPIYGNEIRQIGRMQFCVSDLVDPVTNNNKVYGFCETEELVNNHSGIGSTIYIYQTVKVMGNSLIIFKRRGTLPGPFDTTTIYENRASITWQAWIPIEYPTVQLDSLLNTSSFSEGTINLSISGGVAIFDFYHIKPNTTSLTYIIETKNFIKYSSLYKFNARGILGNVSSFKGGILVLDSDKYNGLRSIKVDTVSEYYDGQMVVTLGY